MVDGLFISGVGMATVFVVLTVIMFLMIGIERLFRDKEDAELVTSGKGNANSVLAGTQQTPGLGSMLNVLGVEVQEQPRDTVEVAAIALALAAHMNRKGTALEGRPITIGGVEYQVDVGDFSTSPVAVTVNGERHWTSLDGQGLPLAVGGVLVIRARMRDAQSNRVWRMAYPLGIGGYWDRRGWSKKE